MKELHVDCALNVALPISFAIARSTGLTRNPNNGNASNVILFTPMWAWALPCTKIRPLKFTGFTLDAVVLNVVCSVALQSGKLDIHLPPIY